MDQTTSYLLIFLVVVGFALTISFINKKLSEKKEGTDEKSILLLQQQLNQLAEQLNRGLSESRETIQKQFSSSAGIIKEVTEKLTRLEDTNKQVVGIADQLEGLERVLKNPKQRGILGEYYLESLLKNLFQPNQYTMQYQFADGSIADAVIFLKDKKEPQSIIPIDSKFSLENYNKIIEEKNEARKEELQKAFKKDLKNRIDETAKYIKPRENTMDFAFMFIPSEGIYYDLLVNQVGTLKVNTRDLVEYAFKEKRVIVVSPTSFAAYLQTVLQGLKALSIEKSVKEILDNVNKLGTHLGAYESHFKKVGSNLSTAVGAYNSASREFGKIDKDVTKITGESIEAEVIELEKPHDES